MAESASSPFRALLWKEWRQARWIFLPVAGVILLLAIALVAAGSVVTKDAPPRKISMGSPARPLRDVPENQLLENQGW